MTKSLRLFLMLAVLLQVVFAVPVHATVDMMHSPQQSGDTILAPVEVKVLRGANLRSGPGTTFGVVGGASAGQTLNIVGRNSAGDWFVLDNGKWIFGELLNLHPDVPVATVTPPVPPDPGQITQSTPTPQQVNTENRWILVADSSADFPGGREHNNWGYFWTEGRGSFNWQTMNQANPDSCFRDPAGKGLEVCRDSINSDPKGDVAVQWKANQGGTYRFEWEGSGISFFKHANLFTTQFAGETLAYSAIVADVIDWEIFYWVARVDTTYRILVYRYDGTYVAPAQSSVRAITPVPLQNNVCRCSSNIYNCTSFSSARAAQQCFLSCGGTSNDVHDLDRDHDGNACEWYGGDPWPN